MRITFNTDLSSEYQIIGALLNILDASPNWKYYNITFIRIPQTSGEFGWERWYLDERGSTVQRMTVSYSIVINSHSQPPPTSIKWLDIVVRPSM